MLRLVHRQNPWVLAPGWTDDAGALTVIDGHVEAASVASASSIMDDIPPSARKPPDAKPPDATQDVASATDPAAVPDEAPVATPELESGKVPDDCTVEGPPGLTMPPHVDAPRIRTIARAWFAKVMKVIAS